MNRWKVRREWRDTLNVYSWVALRPSGLSGDVFFTWREAVDYADRMARTRKVVLPRLRPRGEVTVSATWDYDILVVHCIDASGRVVQGTAADLARHALALLVLAEQEEA